MISLRTAPLILVGILLGTSVYLIYFWKLLLLIVSSKLGLGFWGCLHQMAKKTSSPEMLKTSGKTCISALAKKIVPLEILRLGGNPYKPLGNRWFHATGSGTRIEPLVCTKEIALGAPCKNVGFPWVFLKIASATPLWTPLWPRWRLQNLTVRRKPL